MAEERLDWIDNARGIAIILVVMGHVVSSYHEAGLYQSNTFFNFTSYFIYSFHMALFMLVSGYLCTLKESSVSKGKQILRKLVNYGIPYVFFSALWVVMKMLMSSLTNSAVSLKDLIGIPIYPISFMWFIYALLIMQVIQILIGRQSKAFKIGHLIVAGGGYCIRPLLENVVVSVRFSDCILNDVLKFYIFFVLGTYCFDYILKRIKPKSKVKLLIITGAILVLCNIVTFNNVGLRNLVYSFVIALVGSFFVILAGLLIRGQRWLSYCGKQTLPIYVLQGFVIAATRIIVTHLGLNDGFGVVPIVICTVAGVAIPIIVYLITTKIWKLDGLFYPGRYIKF